MILLYDNSFYGLLTCVFEHYYHQPVQEIYAKDVFQGSLIDTYREVETEEIKAKRVEKAIREKFSGEGYMALYRTFLSNDYHKDCYILEYLIHGFKLGRKIDNYYSEPFVMNIRKLSKKVGFEAHRFLGLLRFEQRDKYLYATFEPDHDILPLIAQHFTDRLQEERLIIYDRKRSKAVLANNKQWIIQEVPRNEAREIFDTYTLSIEEKMLQKLWRGYFEHIAIEGRINPKLQQNFVPKKYRKDILEFQTKKST